MNCEMTRSLLSACHDGELPAETAGRLQQHLDRCSTCREELAGLQALTHLAGTLPDPQVPPLWPALEDSLDEDSLDIVRAVTASPSRTGRRAMLVAIGILLLIGVGAVSLFLTHHHDGHHDHLAVNFDSYLTQFTQQPRTAQDVLVDHYEGEPVTIEQAMGRLPYRPMAAAGPPPGFRLGEAYLLNMPCCRCLQAVYVGADGDQLALFEHEADQPVWFGERPTLTAECVGRSCRIVQFDSRLAFTCRIGPRFATVIGARDLEEVVRIVEYYAPPGDQVHLPGRPVVLQWCSVPPGQSTAGDPTDFDSDRGILQEPGPPGRSPSAAGDDATGD